MGRCVVFAVRFLGCAMREIFACIKEWNDPYRRRLDLGHSHQSISKIPAKTLHETQAVNRLPNRIDSKADQPRVMVLLIGNAGQNLVLDSGIDPATSSRKREDSNFGPFENDM